jgi:hypothetical protein
MIDCYQLTQTGEVTATQTLADLSLETLKPIIASLEAPYCLFKSQTSQLISSQIQPSINFLKSHTRLSGVYHPQAIARDAIQADVPLNPYWQRFPYRWGREEYRDWILQQHIDLDQVLWRTSALQQLILFDRYKPTSRRYDLELLTRAVSVGHLGYLIEPLVIRTQNDPFTERSLDYYQTLVLIWSHYLLDQRYYFVRNPLERESFDRLATIMTQLFTHHQDHTSLNLLQEIVGRWDEGLR